METTKVSAPGSEPNPDNPMTSPYGRQPTPPFPSPFPPYTQRPVSSAQPGLQDEVEREAGFAGVTVRTRAAIFNGLIFFS